MAPISHSATTMLALAALLFASPASASWLNQTLLAAKINASLAAAGSPTPNPLATKVRSAIINKIEGVDQVESYLVGNRTIYHNVKNKTEAQCLYEYTRGRLQYEAELKQGAAFTTVASLSTVGATQNISCFYDPQLGDVLNVVQGNKGACTAGGMEVVIPTAGKFVTRIEMAIDKELSFVGRLNFFVSDTLDSKPTVYSCGWAGGAAISLFPKGYVASSFQAGCMPVNTLLLGRRRLLAPLQGFAINPKLINVQIATADVASSASSSGSGVGPTLEPTGVLQPPLFCTCPLPPSSQNVINTINTFPDPCANGACTTPFSNSTNTTAG